MFLVVIPGAYSSADNNFLIHPPVLAMITCYTSIVTGKQNGKERFILYTLEAQGKKREKDNYVGKKSKLISQVNTVLGPVSTDEL
jgi:hypothetical protein